MIEFSDPLIIGQAFEETWTLFFGIGRYRKWGFLDDHGNPQPEKNQVARG